MALTDTAAFVARNAVVVTATPCEHLPPARLTTGPFGVTPDGRPNAVWFTRDTVRRTSEKFRDVLALINTGAAVA
ncbi:hypothetical protein MY5147_005359 [Beauveria neobassiana]